TATVAEAEASIAGRVTDADTGDGIAGANVAYGTPPQNIIASTTTDADGNYSFTGVVPGTYAIGAQAAGYQLKAPQAVTVGSGEAVTVNIALTPLVIPTPTPTPTPVASPTPTPVASPTPTPVASPTPTPVASPTPTPVASPTPTPPPCEADEITADPRPLRIVRETSATETITVTCADGTPVPGVTVTAEVRTGKKRISVSPSSAVTDANGQALFTITAGKKTGDSRVRFEADGLRTNVTVKVRKK
ncbi:MAG: carboxypeptidase regulatory-like domain-containing protein, partial [Candidatus Brocadia sp.]